MCVCVTWLLVDIVVVCELNAKCVLVCVLVCALVCASAALRGKRETKCALECLSISFASCASK